MTEQRNTTQPLVKYPFTIAMLIICIVIFIVWLNQKGESNATLQSPTDLEQDTSTAVTPPGDFQLKAPSSAGSNSDTPKIVQSMNRNSAPGSVNAPGLEGLLLGLEAKVNANPENINNRLLLAQTYNELGFQDKALSELRSMQSKDPEHVRVNLILASILSQSEDAETLKESLTLLDKVETKKDIQPYLVHMYRGDALIRTKDHKGALTNWKKALETMPVSDTRRAVLEKRIADIGAGS